MIATPGYMVVALDPGLRGCGVAALQTFMGMGGSSSRLVRATYVRGNPSTERGDVLADAEAMASAVHSWVFNLRAELGARESLELVAEWPRVYKAGRAKRGADPNDLLALTAVDGAVAALLDCKASSVEPHAWKGTLGDVEGEDGAKVYLVEERAREELRPEERVTIQLPAKSLQHNVFDAIGIGLHAVGRSLVLNRRRVFPR